MRSTFLLSALGAASAAELNQADLEFMKFVGKYGKSYTSVEEFNWRKDNFKEMDEAIRLLNESQSMSEHGHNQFSDLSEAEWQSRFRQVDVNKAPRSAPPDVMPTGWFSNILQYGWCYLTNCSSTQNEGSSVGMWANGTATSVCPNGAYAFVAAWVMATNYSILQKGTSTEKAPQYNLSVQQILDCSKGFGNVGCSGGDV